MNEFSISGDNIIINTGYAEAYIADELFKSVDELKDIKSAIAYNYGDAITTIGCFYMKFADSEENIDKAPLRILNFPSPITTYPDEITSKNMSFNDGKDSEKYQVLKYSKGSIMMNKVNQKNSDNCEKFMNLLIHGKLPNIPYEEIIKIWESNYLINDLDPGVPSVILQMIISEMYRYKENPKIQFRKVVGDKGINNTDYYAANTRQVAAYTAIFNALTFEAIGDMLTTSLNMTRNGETQSKSPVEKVLAM